MGREVNDPNGVEGNILRLPGLALLPIVTTMNASKTTRQTKFRVVGNEEPCFGYEIHNGVTEVNGGRPLNILDDGTPEGCRTDDRCMGTYIHGILDNPPFIDFLLRPYLGKLTKTTFDYAAFKEEQYNKLAAHVREHIDMDLLYRILQYDSTEENETYVAE
uniref:Cobyric acid synthase n=1 Tax=Ascaris suum TaxID=6253 RepID=F1LG59_ASCSU